MILYRATGALGAGLVGGALHGTGPLVIHASVASGAKVSLGGSPPLLALVTALTGMVLAALGGRIARMQRDRAEGEPVRRPAGR